ncbi:hypothetical protein AB9_087 [Acinetobacter phage vB_AbaM_B9]|nr:hypothetical protein AB9_087 [Acinetobacter phage vB_AbaM_B9]
MENFKYIDGDWGFDCETYPNVITFSFIKSDRSDKRVFEISSRVNELEDFLEFCRESVRKNYRWITFNGKGFDYPLVHWILNKSKAAKSENKKLSLTANQIYKYAMRIIESHKGDGFGIQVKDEDVLIKQVDLFKICHYDNKARMTSLKLLEFNMRLENISDLPFPVGKKLTNDEIDVLIEYNLSDVDATLRFYEICLDSIKFREELTEKYGFDCMNLNDGKVGSNFFMRKIEEKVPNTFYENVGGKKKLKKTPRDFIRIKDCIFNYVSFKDKGLIALKEWFSKQIITETKGVFSNIEEHLLGDLSQYAEMTTKSVKFKSKPSDSEINEFLKIHPKGWIDKIELKSMETLKDENGNPVKENYIDEKGRVKQRVVKVPKVSYYGYYRVAETLNVVLDDFRIDFGLGGQHGSKVGAFHSTEDLVICDLDVKSYYPNLAIANRVYPEHLNEVFCDAYEEFYHERAKVPKSNPINKAYKDGLNIVYGDSNSEFSAFYDPKYTMSITINGQLTLCMLMERLIDVCGIKIIQSNTDGFTFLIKKDMLDIMKTHVSRWENLTGLEMEDAYYKSMFMRDVNNYVGLYEDGSVKSKGAYEYEPLRSMKLTHMHKNHSALVVPMAVEHELLGRGYAEDFIRSHKDKFDFMLRTKVPRGSRLVLEMDGEDIEQQNICRYYASEDGGYLTKIMPPLKEGDEDRRMSIESGIKVKTCNDINDFSWDINYDYYIEQADKLLEFFR